MVSRTLLLTLLALGAARLALHSLGWVRVGLLCGGAVALRLTWSWARKSEEATAAAAASQRSTTAAAARVGALLREHPSWAFMLLLSSVSVLLSLFGFATVFTASLLPVVIGLAAKQRARERDVFLAFSDLARSHSESNHEAEEGETCEWLNEVVETLYGAQCEHYAHDFIEQLRIRLGAMIPASVGTVDVQLQSLGTVPPRLEHVIGRPFDDRLQPVAHADVTATLAWMSGVVLVATIKPWWAESFELRFEVRNVELLARLSVQLIADRASTATALRVSFAERPHVHCEVSLWGIALTALPIGAAFSDAVEGALDVMVHPKFFEYTLVDGGDSVPLGWTGAISKDWHPPTLPSSGMAPPTVDAAVSPPLSGGAQQEAPPAAMASLSDGAAATTRVEPTTFELEFQEGKVGLTYHVVEGRLQVLQIKPNGQAHNHNILPEDVLISVNGATANPKGIVKLMKKSACVFPLLRLRTQVHLFLSPSSNAIASRVTPLSSSFKHTRRPMRIGFMRMPATATTAAAAAAAVAPSPSAARSATVAAKTPSRADLDPLGARDPASWERVSNGGQTFLWNRVTGEIEWPSESGNGGGAMGVDLSSRLR